MTFLCCNLGYFEEIKEFLCTSQWWKKYRKINEIKHPGKNKNKVLWQVSMKFRRRMKVIPAVYTRKGMRLVILAHLSFVFYER